MLTLGGPIFDMDQILVHWVYMMSHYQHHFSPCIMMFIFCSILCLFYFLFDNNMFAPCHVCSNRSIVWICGICAWLCRNVDSVQNEIIVIPPPPKTKSLVSLFVSLPSVRPSVCPTCHICYVTVLYVMRNDLFYLDLYLWGPSGMTLQRSC